MAKIICISKYPPIEGGIAAKTFWLTKALGERGHEIHVVTDRLGIAPEYSHPMESEEPALKGVFVHRPQGDIPWHIPNDSHRAVELLDLAIKVIRDSKADVIDTGYLIPYGLVGYLASQITGVPFLLRHGGSDIQKFLKAGIWDNLIKNAFTRESLVITDRTSLNTISDLCDRVAVLPPYVPDTSFFKPLPGAKKQRPTLALIGKANYYWQHKGWHRAVEIMERLGSEFRFIIVSQGVGFDDFRKHVEQKISGDVEWQNFVHPMKMPDLLNSVDGMFSFNTDMPFIAYSNLVPEVLYSGGRIITDNPYMFEYYKTENIDLEFLKSNLLIVSSSDFASDSKMISTYFKDSAASRHSQKKNSQEYQAYVDANEKAVLSVIR